MTKSAALKKATVKASRRHVTAVTPEVNEAKRLMSEYDLTEKELEELGEKAREITQRRSQIVKSLIAARGNTPFTYRGRRMTPVHRPKGRGGDIYFLRTPADKKVEEIG